MKKQGERKPADETEQEPAYTLGTTSQKLTA